MKSARRRLLFIFLLILLWFLGKEIWRQLHPAAPAVGHSGPGTDDKSVARAAKGGLLVEIFRVDAPLVDGLMLQAQPGADDARLHELALAQGAPAAEHWFAIGKEESFADTWPLTWVETKIDQTTGKVIPYPDLEQHALVSMVGTQKFRFETRHNRYYPVDWANFASAFPSPDTVDSWPHNDNLEAWAEKGSVSCSVEKSLHLGNKDFGCAAFAKTAKERLLMSQNPSILQYITSQDIPARPGTRLGGIQTELSQPGAEGKPPGLLVSFFRLAGPEPKARVRERTMARLILLALDRKVAASLLLRRNTMDDRALLASLLAQKSSGAVRMVSLQATATVEKARTALNMDASHPEHYYESGIKTYYEACFGSNFQVDPADRSIDFEWMPPMVFLPFPTRLGRPVTFLANQHIRIEAPFPLITGTAQFLAAVTPPVTVPGSGIEPHEILLSFGRIDRPDAPPSLAAAPAEPTGVSESSYALVSIPAAAAEKLQTGENAAERLIDQFLEQETQVLGFVSLRLPGGQNGGINARAEYPYVYEDRGPGEPSWEYNIWPSETNLNWERLDIATNTTLLPAPNTQVPINEWSNTETSTDNTNTDEDKKEPSEEALHQRLPSELWEPKNLPELKDRPAILKLEPEPSQPGAEPTGRWRALVGRRRNR